MNGEDPADLPVHISFEEDLTLNMRTAKEIDFSPKFTILSEAELINEFEVISNRPLNEAFIAQEASLTDTLYSSHLTSTRDYIDNPRSLDIYTNFLIEEAIRNSPEIRQLNAQIAGMERRTASFKRERFVPTLGLGAQTGHIFSRDGAGSTGPGGDPTDDTWNVGINLNLPLFQGGATNINIQKARIEINKLNDQKA